MRNLRSLPLCRQFRMACQGWWATHRKAVVHTVSCVAFLRPPWVRAGAPCPTGIGGTPCHGASNTNSPAFSKSGNRCPERGEHASPRRAPRPPPTTAKAGTERLQHLVHHGVGALGGPGADRLHRRPVCFGTRTMAYIPRRPTQRCRLALGRDVHRRYGLGPRPGPLPLPLGRRDHGRVVCGCHPDPAGKGPGTRGGGLDPSGRAALAGSLRSAHGPEPVRVLNARTWMMGAHPLTSDLCINDLVCHLVGADGGSMSAVGVHSLTRGVMWVASITAPLTCCAPADTASQWTAPKAGSPCTADVLVLALAARVTAMGLAAGRVCPSQG